MKKNVLNVRWIIIFLVVILGYTFKCELMGRDPKEKLTEYLSNLVSMNTLSSDKAANQEALRWVEKQLKGLPLHFHHHEYDGFHSLVISSGTTKKTKVWLVAHIDVVAGKDELFHPLVKDNKMYGRGAYDMKMAIACYILLMHELKDQLKDLDVGIMLVSDEEIGGLHGVKLLLNEGYSSEVVLLPDGGFDWNIEEAAKGIVQLKIASKGKTAHGSRPWLGENAISKLMNVLHEIETYFESEQLNHADYYPTVNIGSISGGKSTNQVPEEAEAKLDIRYPPGIHPDRLAAALSKILKKHPGVSMEKLIEGSSHQQNLRQAAFDEFKSLAKKLYGIEVGSIRSHGASDARFFAEKNIPVLVIAPKGGEIHSDEEWVDLEDMARFYEVMKAWVLKVAAR